MDNLHCYFNIEHTVVASSLEEAKAKWDEWTFTDPSNYDDEELEEIRDIQPIPDDEIIAIHIEDELKNKPEGLIINKDIWKAAAKSWAMSQGCGVLCSIDY